MSYLLVNSKWDKMEAKCAILRKSRRKKPPGWEVEGGTRLAWPALVPIELDG
jgi:hypothetical protein